MTVLVQVPFYVFHEHESHSEQPIAVAAKLIAGVSRAGFRRRRRLVSGPAMGLRIAADGDGGSTLDLSRWTHRVAGGRNVGGMLGHHFGRCQPEVLGE